MGEVAASAPAAPLHHGWGKGPPNPASRIQRWEKTGGISEAGKDEVRGTCFCHFLDLFWQNSGVILVKGLFAGNKVEISKNKTSHSGESAFNYV